MKHWTRTSALVVLALLLTMAGPAQAERVEETPSALAMTGDALLARPLLLATTLGGSAIYVVSYPFSYLGGNSGEAAEVLVGGPFRATFSRCLGCTSVTTGTPGRNRNLDND